jgi:hypothetical protein
MTQLARSQRVGQCSAQRNDVRVLSGLTGMVANVPPLVACKLMSGASRRVVDDVLGTQTEDVVCTCSHAFLC